MLESPAFHALGAVPMPPRVKGQRLTLLPPSTIADRFRSLAQRFNEIQSKSPTAAVLRHNLDAYCTQGGWLLIESFDSEVLSIRDEWRLHVQRCHEHRADPTAEPPAKQVAENLFRRVVTEWLVRDDHPDIRAAGGLDTFVSIGGRETPETHPELISAGVETELIDGQWVSIDPFKADEFADACNVLAEMAAARAPVVKAMGDEPINLTKRQFRVLEVLHDASPVLQSTYDVAAACAMNRNGIKRADAGKVIKELIKKELACRPRGPNGGATATAAGRAQVILHRDKKI